MPPWLKTKEKQHHFCNFAMANPVSKDDCEILQLEINVPNLCKGISMMCETSHKLC